MAATGFHYHGTNTEAKARSILEHGILPDSLSVYRHGYEPRLGYVYMAGGQGAAAKHASLPVSGYWSSLDRDMAEHPFGYVFAIPATALSSPLEPDEDDVGMFMAFHAEEFRKLPEIVQIDGESVGVRDYRFRSRLGEPDAAAKRRAWTTMRGMLTAEDMTRLEFDDGTASAGKKILRSLPASAKARLIEWGNGSVAHPGAVAPSECWRLPKFLAPSVIHGSASLRDVAIPVSLYDFAPAPGAGAAFR